MKHRMLVILMVPFAMIALTQRAEAFTECDDDGDCIDGFICESMGASTCAVVCTPDGECDEDPDCETEEWSMCVPGPCSSDDDCSEGMRCLELEYVEGCAAPMPGCGEGEECPDYDPLPEDEDCGEVITEAFCLPPWIAPCETAEECGDGFECVPDEMCACSGGGGSDGDVPPCPEGEDCFDEPRPDDEWEDDCTCEPTDENYCRPLEVDCSDDAVCPDGWTCEFWDAPVSCWVEEDGTEHCDEESDREAPDGTCMPPFYDDIGFGGGSSFSADGDADVDMEDALDAATGGENARPTGHSSDGDADGGQGLDGDTGGCQAVPGATGGASAVLMMLPLLIGLALRRR